MTEQFSDVLDEIGMIKHIAKAHAVCIKHRTQYQGMLTTAGIFYTCFKCYEEQYANPTRTIEDVRSDTIRAGSIIT